MIFKRGYIQVYTGEGKGKTTAAIGLAIRAVGASGRVLFAQFIKKKRCSEHHVLTTLYPSIEVRQYGQGCFLRRKPNQKDITSAKMGIREIIELAPRGDYDLIVLDELNVALHHGLVDTEDVHELLRVRHPKTEIVITGRYAHDLIIEMADLVTEMRNIKHYSQRGLKARKGIEK